MTLARPAPVSRVLALLAVGALAGCAYRYETADGRQGAVGLLWVEYQASPASPAPPPPADSAALAPMVLEPTPPAVLERTAGFYVDNSSLRRGVGLGYRSVLVVIPADEATSSLQLDTTRPLDATYQVERAGEDSQGVGSAPAQGETAQRGP